MVHSTHGSRPKAHIQYMHVDIIKELDFNSSILPVCDSGKLENLFKRISVPATPSEEGLR